MHFYYNLFDYFLSDNNIKFAIDNLSKNKSRNKKQDKIFFQYKDNIEKYIPVIRNYAENFKNSKHKTKEINDGISQKKRKIMCPTIKEQIVHHMVMNVLQPIFMETMYAHSYGSIPYRGSHKAKEVIEKWIKNDPENTIYCLKTDIRKFFESVPHDTLKQKLYKKIVDCDFLKILYEIIDVVKDENGNTKDRELPLGFYTSQWFANWFLEDLDRYIKEVLHVKYYVRYMDDMVCFGSDKSVLHEVQKKIADFLTTKLGLHMKDNWQVFPLPDENDNHGRAVDFMGFKFYKNRTTLRKSIMHKITKKAKKISKKIRPTIFDVRQMLSYNGWLKHTKTHKMYLKFIKPHINFGDLKYKASIYQKKNIKNN